MKLVHVPKVLTEILDFRVCCLVGVEVEFLHHQLFMTQIIFEQAEFFGSNLGQSLRPPFL